MYVFKKKKRKIGSIEPPFGRMFGVVYFDWYSLSERWESVTVRKIPSASISFRSVYGLKNNKRLVTGPAAACRRLFSWKSLCAHAEDVNERYKLAPHFLLFSCQLAWRRRVSACKVFDGMWTHSRFILFSFCFFFFVIMCLSPDISVESQWLTLLFAAFPLRVQRQP